MASQSRKRPRSRDAVCFDHVIGPDALQLVLSYCPLTTLWKFCATARRFHNAWQTPQQFSTRPVWWKLKKDNVAVAKRCRPPRVWFSDQAMLREYRVAWPMRQLHLDGVWLTPDDGVMLRDLDVVSIRTSRTSGNPRLPIEVWQVPRLVCRQNRPWYLPTPPPSGPTRLHRITLDRVFLRNVTLPPNITHVDIERVRVERFDNDMTLLQHVQTLTVRTPTLLVKRYALQQFIHLTRLELYDARCDEFPDTIRHLVLRKCKVRASYTALCLPHLETLVLDEATFVEPLDETDRALVVAHLAKVAVTPDEHWLHVVAQTQEAETQQNTRVLALREACRHHHHYSFRRNLEPFVKPVDTQHLAPIVWIYRNAAFSLDVWVRVAEYWTETKDYPKAQWAWVRVERVGEYHGGRARRRACVVLLGGWVKGWWTLYLQEALTLVGTSRAFSSIRLQAALRCFERPIVTLFDAALAADDERKGVPRMRPLEETMFLR